MKHLITKTVYTTGATKEIHREPIPSDDIKQTRSELHQIIICDRILLSYEEIE